MPMVDGEVLRASVALLGHQGRATELGVIEQAGQRRTVWGLYDDLDALVACAEEAQKADGANIYIGVNPRPTNIPGMSRNALGLYVRAKAANIEVVTALLTDIDPVRPKGQASTEVELAHARTLAEKVCDWAEEQGFQRPVRSMSGNGIQIWWALPETPVHPGYEQKLGAFTHMLQKKFNTGAAKIDSTFDLPRVCKAIGTTSLKGEATTDRPHRKTYFLDPPDRVDDFNLLNYILGLHVETEEVPPDPPSEAFKDVNPLEICAGVRELLLKGHPENDRSAGIHWLVLAMKSAGSSFDATMSVVREYDQSHGDKLANRDAISYVKRSWDKADGNLPCRKLRGAGYCPKPCSKEKDTNSFTIQRGLLSLAFDHALEAIAKDPRIYVRGENLVTVTSWNLTSDTIRRDSGTPVIQRLSSSRVLILLSDIVYWQRYNEKAGCDLLCDVPKDLAAGVSDAGEWPGTRLLEGLTTSPLIRADGRVVHTPGYDPQSRLFYVPDGPIPVIGTDPHAAAAALLDIVKDFPFRGEVDAAGWLAAVLTPIARSLCPCVPMNCFDANCPGTGKSLLTDLIALIVSGRGMARGSYTQEEEEMRKRVFAHAITGDTMILIDNVPEQATVGWASLDRALTGEELVDRVLGKSQNSTHRNTMSWYLTGNNILLGGDVVRRSIHIRLNTSLEHPEQRPPSDFAQPALKVWAREHRTELLGHALTILSCFLKQKSPPVKEVMLGSFEEWSRIVRGSVLWTTGHDVLELLANQNTDLDSSAQAHIALLEAMVRHPKGLTAADMLQSDDRGLREAVAAFCDGDRPTTRSLGYALRAVKGRVRAVDGIGNAALHRTSKGRSRKSAKWTIVPQ